MIRKLALAASLAVSAFAFASAPASATTFYLDSHEVQAAGDDYAGPASDVQTLTAGKPYKVQVAGGVSLWSARVWDLPSTTICGSPMPGASFQSPGQGPGKVGVYADGRFAIPRRPSQGPCPPLPSDPGNNFQISTDGGLNFFHPTALSHKAATLFTYEVTGEGFPLLARFFDPNASDNYGQFRIIVTDQPLHPH